MTEGHGVVVIKRKSMRMVEMILETHHLNHLMIRETMSLPRWSQMDRTDGQAQESNWQVVHQCQMMTRCTDYTRKLMVYVKQRAGKVPIWMNPLSCLWNVVSCLTDRWERMYRRAEEVAAQESSKSIFSIGLNWTVTLEREGSQRMSWGCQNTLRLGGEKMWIRWMVSRPDMRMPEYQDIIWFRFSHWKKGFWPNQPVQALLEILQGTTETPTEDYKPVVKGALA